MTAIRSNQEIGAYFSQAGKWRQEMRKLRRLLLDSGLTEEWKWAKPCYSFQKHNVVVMLEMKEYGALLFCKGALLADPHGLLTRPSENTQAARQFRFRSLKEIEEKKAALKGIVKEAVEVERAGREVVYKKPGDFVLPVELVEKFARSSHLKKAFEALTPGRQRGYVLYFSAPKQAKTRQSRIEKVMPQVLRGKGLRDE